MSTLTAFGREVRKLRIDNDKSLGEMADALKVSAAFASSVETGRKNPPADYVSRVASYFKLNGEATDRLQRLGLQSRSVVRLRPQAKNQEVVAEFARKFDSLQEKERDEIMAILQRV